MCKLPRILQLYQTIRAKSGGAYAGYRVALRVLAGQRGRMSRATGGYIATPKVADGTSVLFAAWDKLKEK